MVSIDRSTGIAKYKFKKDSIGCRHGAEWMQEGENFRLIFRGCRSNDSEIPSVVSLIVEYLKGGKREMKTRSREVYLWISLFLPTSRFFVHASLERTKRKITIRR